MTGKFNMSNKTIFFFFLSVFLISCENILNNDDVPPEIVITNPTESTTITGPIEVSVIVSDKSKIKKVLYFIDDELVGSTKSRPYAYTLDLSLWANDSTHSLMAIAEDQFGNKGYSEIINIFIPSFLYPSVDIIYPENNSYYEENSEIIFTWEKISQVSKYIFEISDNEDFQDLINTFETEDTSLVISLNKGKYYIHVKGVNNVSKCTGWSRNIKLYVGTVIFTKYFGGSDNEIGYCVKENILGEYIVTGAVTGSNSIGVHYSKLLVTKLGKTGDLFWSKTFDDYRVGKSLVIDGEYYIVTGRSEDGKICLLKFDSNGSIVWSKTYNLSGEGNSIIIGSDCYYITGYTNSYGAGRDDIILLKTDLSGEILYSKYYGGAEDDCGNILLKTNNDLIFIGGYTDSFSSGDSDYWILSLDLDGHLLWNRTYGGYNWDVGFSASFSQNNNLLITGRSSSYDNGILVLSFNTNGDLNWSNTFGDRFSEGSYSIVNMNNSDFLITGYLSSQETGSDVILLHISSAGNILELNKLLNIGEDVGYFIEPATDGGVIITGFITPPGKSNYDLLIIRTDDNFSIDQIEE